MNSALLEWSKKQLLARRSKLLRLYEENAQDERENDEEVEADWPDRAASVEQNALLRQLTDRERVELEDIDAALRRMAVGRFGQCEACGGAVGQQRMRALPEARLCVRCASDQAFREGRHA